MILTLKEVKEFVRLEEDDTEEDSLLTLMIKNAEIYIKNTNDIEIDETNEDMVNQAKLIMLFIVTDFYENREITVKISEKRRVILNGMIMQLKYSYGDGAI